MMCGAHSSGHRRKGSSCQEFLLCLSSRQLDEATGLSPALAIAGTPSSVTRVPPASAFGVVNTTARFGVAMTSTADVQLHSVTSVAAAACSRRCLLAARSLIAPLSLLVSRAILHSYDY